MKEPKCKICGGKHYAAFCFQAPRKAIKVNKPIVKKISKPIKRTAIKSQPQSNRAKLVKEADRVFSTYIRKKSSINGYCRCVTCGTRDKWQNMDNGHYLSRRYMQIRYDEMNCHVQCKRCNQTLSGNLTKYKDYLIKTYGFDPTEMLKRRVQTRGKVTINDIQNIIAKYS